jgi:hypothetical protein
MSTAAARNSTGGTVAAAAAPPPAPPPPAAAAAAPPQAQTNSKREESVCVAVNIRPLIDIELDQGCQECLFVAPGQNQVAAGSHAFTYDHVFGGDGGADLAGLYPKCVAPLLDGLFRGYNATVFAYGAGLFWQGGRRAAFSSCCCV